MELSLSDFNALSNDMSSRDVRIAKLEMELQYQASENEQVVRQLVTERDALLHDVLNHKAEIERLQQENDRLMTAFENVRFENHWMKQYIWLSMEHVRTFFESIKDYHLLAAIKAFVLQMLPESTTSEELALACAAMKMPDTDQGQLSFGHVDQVVVSAEAGAKVMYGPAKEDDQSGTE